MARVQHPLIETWTPAQALAEQFPAYRHMAEGNAKTREWPLKRQLHEIDVDKVGGLECVQCVLAWPHVDDGHNRWFVMWNLSANGHVLHSRDQKKLPNDGIWWGDKPHEVEPQISVTMNLGDMVLLDAHRVHWMDGIPAGPRWKRWFIGSCYDVAIRPTREKAEAFMLSKIRIANA